MLKTYVISKIKIHNIYIHIYIYIYIYFFFFQFLPLSQIPFPYLYFDSKHIILLISTLCPLCNSFFLSCRTRTKNRTPPQKKAKNKNKKKKQNKKTKQKSANLNCILRDSGNSIFNQNVTKRMNLPLPKILFLGNMTLKVIAQYFLRCLLQNWVVVAFYISARNRSSSPYNKRRWLLEESFSLFLLLVWLHLIIVAF